MQLVSATRPIAMDYSLRNTTVEGHMEVEQCNISKAVVNPYYGREIPNYVELGLEPDREYKLYRDPQELEAAAATFNGKPLLIQHKVVSADQHPEDLVVGCTGVCTFEAPYLVCRPLTVWTAEGVDAVQSKSQEQLSCGYRYRADMTPGTTPEGVAFDGVMRDIIGNHVALVSEGRAGPDVVVSDETPPEFSKMRFPKFMALLASAIPALKPEQITAFDAALDEEMKAEDCSLSEDETSEALKAAKDAKGGKDELTAEEKEKALKSAKDKKAADKAAKDSDPAMKPKVAADQALTPGAVAKAIQLAADSAEASAVKRVTALYDARRIVEPLVGVCALDSADAVYEFALKTAGVETKDVHPSAFPAMVKMALDARTNKTPRRDAAQAHDGASAAVLAFPGIGRIKAG